MRLRCPCFRIPRCHSDRYAVIARACGDGYSGLKIERERYAKTVIESERQAPAAFDTTKKHDMCIPAGTRALGPWAFQRSVKADLLGCAGHSIGAQSHKIQASFFQPSSRD